MEQELKHDSLIDIFLCFSPLSHTEFPVTYISIGAVALISRSGSSEQPPPFWHGVVKHSSTTKGNDKENMLTDLRKGCMED